MRWAVDGDFHSVTPRFLTGAGAWYPAAADAATKSEPFGGDPVGIGKVGAVRGERVLE